MGEDTQSRLSERVQGHAACKVGGSRSATKHVELLSGEEILTTAPQRGSCGASPRPARVKFSKTKQCAVELSLIQ